MLEVDFRIILKINIKYILKVLKFSEEIYLHYLHDATIFLKHTKSVINLLKIFKHFFHISGLKPDKSKCEIAGICVLKGVKVAFCGMRCVNLYEDTIKIFGIHFSYNKQLENNKNFKNTLQKLSSYNCGETYHLKGKLKFSNQWLYLK